MITVMDYNGCFVAYSLVLVFFFCYLAVNLFAYHRYSSPVAKKHLEYSSNPIYQRLYGAALGFIGAMVLCAATFLICAVCKF
jgi:hypothetical protein